MRTLAHTLRTAVLGSVVMALGACGGGGGGSSKTAQQGNSNSSTNAAPTISGQPSSSVQAGQSYSFVPSAQDPEGAALQFTVQNLPSWATFDATTGRIAGAPSAAAIGSYEQISIAVSDGVQSAQLAPFAIAVVDVGVAVGAATVSWTPPTSNTDGSALNNLAGYRVMYGRSANDLSQSVEIDNPSVSTYVVDNLASGTWYFAVVAVTTQGGSSDLSNVASKSVS